MRVMHACCVMSCDQGWETEQLLLWTGAVHDVVMIGYGVDSMAEISVWFMFSFRDWGRCDNNNIMRFHDIIVVGICPTTIHVTIYILYEVQYMIRTCYTIIVPRSQFRPHVRSPCPTTVVLCDVPFFSYIEHRISNGYRLSSTFLHLLSYRIWF